MCHYQPSDQNKKGYYWHNTIIGPIGYNQTFYVLVHKPNVSINVMGYLNPGTFSKCGDFE